MISRVPGSNIRSLSVPGRLEPVVPAMPIRGLMLPLAWLSGSNGSFPRSSFRRVQLAGFGSFKHLFHHIYGYGEADADVAAAGRENRCIDPYDLSVDIYQRSTGISFVYRSISLDEFLMRKYSHVLATLCANDPRGYGLHQPEWIPNCEHPITDLQGVGIPKLGSRKTPAFDLQYGYIGSRICCNQACRVFLVRFQNHLNLVSTFHHVPVRQDVPSRIEYETRPHSLLPVFPRSGALLEEAPEDLVMEKHAEERVIPEEGIGSSKEASGLYDSH
jgi:hypothetical protein